MLFRDKALLCSPNRRGAAATALVAARQLDETRLPLDEIAALAEQHGADVAAPIEALRARAGEPISWRDVPMADAARGIAAALRRSAADADPDQAEALHDAAEELRRFAAEDGPRTGAALVQDAAAGPTLAVAAVDAAGWLGGALKDRQVVLLSATLGRHEEGLDELQRACRRLGFHEVHPIAVAPARFGTMTFRLADRAVPPPLDAGGVPNPRFFDAAAGMVRAAAQEGRTLVLCASSGDVEELAARLPAGALLHRRGDRLSRLVERFRSDPHALLVTPGAWAGLDLPGLVDNVVVLRLPLGRPDPLRESTLAAALERRGLTDADARSILANEARGDAMRRLTQGMGRGVRTPDDSCTVWIADPRFPLPPAMVADLRRGLTQGPARGWEDMAKAIPLRFRQPPGRSAYDRARVIEPAVADTA
jgi:Rad3-related DNA helicase